MRARLDFGIVTVVDYLTRGSWLELEIKLKKSQKDRGILASTELKSSQSPTSLVSGKGTRARLATRVDLYIRRRDFVRCRSC